MIQGKRTREDDTTDDESRKKAKKENDFKVTVMKPKKQFDFFYVDWNSPTNTESNTSSSSSSSSSSYSKNHQVTNQKYSIDIVKSLFESMGLEDICHMYVDYL